MKKYLILIFLLSVYACSKPQKREAIQQITLEPRKSDTSIKKEVTYKNIEEVVFKDTIGKAVLIGEKIELLDNELKIVDDISDLTRTIVDLVAVSDSLYNLSKDFCDAFWYVKIKSGDKKGIVNGRQVFKIQDSKQNTTFTVDGNKIEILTTEFLGMGVVYQGDLMGCPVNQPILIKDHKNDFFGLVDLIPNEFSRQASWDNEYPFFELREDDGSYDEIDSTLIEEGKIKLKIHRYFQEGENDYEVLLKFDQNKYTAEYLNFGEIKYE